MIEEKFLDIAIASVPQIIDEFVTLSGGQRFNRALSSALGQKPEALLLDEPTNHLDLYNRRSLVRMLEAYRGTLIVATHDRELLRRCVHIIWHINNGQITVFRGNYDDYVSRIDLERQSITQQLDSLGIRKKAMHQDLMREQERIAKSRASGEKKVATRRWMKSVGDSKKTRAEGAQGSKLRNIDSERQRLSEQLSEIRVPEVIVPKFQVSHRDMGDRTIVSIRDGSISYGNKIVLQSINLSVSGRERLAILGANGSGKTTLARAICGDESVLRSGDWDTPQRSDIGYLDQHYENLNVDKTVVETIAEVNSSWSHADIRCHLNDFLFRKNEEVNSAIRNLSGGERALLSLAKIAAQPPKLLVLDEITNNIDMETQDHLVEILREYLGAMVVISHNEEFLSKIRVTEWVIEHNSISGTHRR
jgi:ATPase subunit of ABC transporter with duplicated ATPase domains